MTSSATAPEIIRVGTRGSALATTQTGHVAQRLEELTGRAIETVRIRTDGDILTGSLAQMGGTGVFVTALRAALLDGRCDVAVHSLKDLPTEPAPGLTIVTPEREDPRDALCARDGLTLAELPRGARVGTGSPRRAAQLRAVRPDLDVVDIRGNVGTRLARVHGDDADLDAVVLAAAGLSRLGLLEHATEVLDPSVVAPAAGQGALAVEVRSTSLGDAGLADALAAIDHAPTRLAVLAERALLARLEAGCAAPVGAYAVLDGSVLTLAAVVARPDGGEQLRHTASVPVPSALDGDTHPDRAAGAAGADRAARDLGTRVADALIADGAAHLAPLAESGAANRPSGSGTTGGSGPTDRSDGPGGTDRPVEPPAAPRNAAEATAPADLARRDLRDGGYRGEPT